jgi:hypothetical protein
MRIIRRIVDVEAMPMVSTPAVRLAMRSALHAWLGDATEATYAYLVDGRPATEDDADDAIRVTVAAARQ